MPLPWCIFPGKGERPLLIKGSHDPWGGDMPWGMLIRQGVEIDQCGQTGIAVGYFWALGTLPASHIQSFRIGHVREFMVGPRSAGHSYSPLQYNLNPQGVALATHLAAPAGSLAPPSSRPHANAGQCRPGWSLERVGNQGGRSEGLTELAACVYG